MAITSVKATINGTEYSLTYNSSSGKYEATLTAPSGSSFNMANGGYPVSITALNSAGNSTTVDTSDPTLGNSLYLVVKEKVIPTISLLSPSSGAYITNNKPTITFTIKDNTIQTSGFSGIDIATLKLKINGGSDITSSSMTVTPITGGYNCSYTPANTIADGNCTITVNVKDNDGNAATQASTTFIVDTVSPELSVSSPANNLETNQSTLLVEGTTTEQTSNPISVLIQVNGEAAISADITDGNFSESVTLQIGSNTVTITATDAAGKSTVVTRTVTYSITAPVITSVTLVPNPVDGGTTYTISVTAS